MEDLPPRHPGTLGPRLWLYVNFDCNLRCRYCVTGSEPGVRRPRLSLGQLRSLVDQAVEAGFQQLAVSGGEPFLHADILAMLDWATSRLPTIVLTNATLLESPRLAGLGALSRRNLAVQVSLDAANPDLNDLHRGRGSWERAVRGLRLLLELGFAVAVRCTLAGQTEAEVEELSHFLRGLGVPEDRSYAMPVVKGGRWNEGPDPTFGDLPPEPTVAGDGLYWHPLKVDPTLAVATEILPLAPALQRLAEQVERIGPGSAPPGYR